MIETFNTIVFSLSVLFGLEVPIFSDHTSINISTEKNTIEIYYSDLSIYEDDKVNKELIIGYLDSLKTINFVFSDLNLISSKKIQKNDGFDYQIKLNYKSANSIKEYFKIDLDSCKIYVYADDIIKINKLNSLNTNHEFGELMSFKKSSNNYYSIRYDWDINEYSDEIIKLIK